MPSNIFYSLLSLKDIGSLGQKEEGMSFKWPNFDIKFVIKI